MRKSKVVRALPLVLVAALMFGLVGIVGCASEGSTNVWGQRTNIPYEENTVGAELGIWPSKEVDIYVQWVTPRLIEGELSGLTSEMSRQRLASLLSDYIVLRVIAANHKVGWSPFFEYDRWSMLVEGQEYKPLVPSGETPTAEGGYFMGEVPAGTTHSGWVLFRRVEAGPRSVNVIYDFGYQRTNFSFSPLMRR